VLASSFVRVVKDMSTSLGTGGELLRSCAEAVQKLCRSCAEKLLAAGAAAWRLDCSVHSAILFQFLLAVMCCVYRQVLVRCLRFGFGFTLPLGLKLRCVPNSIPQNSIQLTLDS